MNGPIPGIKHEGSYLPMVTLRGATEAEWDGVPKTGAATWIGNVDRVAPWRKLRKAIVRKAEQN